MTVPTPQTTGAVVAPPRIYARKVTGRFRRLRTGLSVFLQALLFLGPWLRWEGRPALLFDLPARKFHLLGTTFWPQETYFVLILLVFLGVTLFASTTLAGRLWCGYACPQTLLTQSFMLVERLFEGDRARRIRFDKAAWGWEKTWRKLGKHTVWALMAAWLGFTLAAYLRPAEQLIEGAPELYFAAFCAVLAYLDFGFFREQFCVYVCPYGRVQSSMLDADSLVVSYDRDRGEPRGRKGGCVDCTVCVQVCPMGIDIRDGLQMECIQCAACIDGCDAIMARLGREPGLIGYSSENRLAGRPGRIWRPRVAVYTAVLLLLAGLFAGLMAVRSPIHLDGVRTSSVFELTPDGRITNAYVLKLTNKEHRDRSVLLRLEGLAEAELITPQNPLHLPPESLSEARILVVRPGGGPSVAPFRIVAEDTADADVRQEWETRFLGGQS